MQIKEATYSVQIRRCFEKDLWFIGCRATAGIGIVWLDHLPAKNSDIEVFRFFLVAHGEELSCEEAFVCNWRVSRFMRCLLLS